MPVVAVVDPYSSGRQLVAELKAQDYEVIAVRSSLALDESFLKSWEPQHFSTVLTIGTDEDAMIECAEALKEMQVFRVLAGSEPGVETSDELNELLGLEEFGNSSQSSFKRRNKRAMQEAVAAHGLRSTMQLEVGHACVSSSSVRFS